MVLYLFAVTFSWFVISQLYNKVLRVLGCLGALFRLLTGIIIREPGGLLSFIPAFLHSQSCWWFWLQADGTAALSHEKLVKD